MVAEAMCRGSGGFQEESKLLPPGASGEESDLQGWSPLILSTGPLSVHLMFAIHRQSGFRQMEPGACAAILDQHNDPRALPGTDRLV
jgi:hypothetical protein